MKRQCINHLPNEVYKSLNNPSPNIMDDVAHLQQSTYNF